MLAYAYLGVGDTAAALTQLERGIDAGEMRPSYYPLSMHMFDSVRQSARFAALMQRVGLTESGFTTATGGRPNRH